MAMENWRRVFIVTVGFLEALIFSGCLFGWTSLVHILQQEGVYSYLCEANSSDSHGSKTFSTNIKNDTSHFLTNDADSSFLSSEPTVEFQFVFEDDQNDIQIDTIDDVRLPCDNQIKQLSLIYTMAGIMYGLTAVGVGFALDYLGLWFTRFLASILMTTGFILLAFTSKDGSWFLWPALNLIALGTNQLRLSSFQFANLFPQRRSTIILAYSAGYSISTVVFLVVQYTYYIGISYKLIILVLGGVSLLTFPVTLLMPKMKIGDNVDEGYNGSNRNKLKKLISKKHLSYPQLEKSKHKTLDPTVEKSGASNSKIEIKQRKIPLGKSLFTTSSALHLYWHFINFFSLFYYSVSFNAWAYKTTNDPKDVAFYNKVSGLCQIIAPVFIPLGGYVTDTLMLRASKEENQLERTAAQLEAPAYIVLMSTFFTILLSICTMSTSKYGIYISLVIVAICRPLLVGSCAAYIRIRFYPEHFNRLNGIYSTIVSLMCFVQYPFYIWMFSSDIGFTHSHWVLTFLLILSTASPIHVMVRSSTRKFARTYLRDIDDLNSQDL